MKPIRLCVLISGNGGNLQALIDAIAGGRLFARIERVIANRSAAYGLQRAGRAGLDKKVHTLRRWLDQGGTRESYDTALADLVEDAAPDYVVMLGWMHLLSQQFIDRFPGRIINLHPALPGHFPGANAIQEAYDAFARGRISHSGVMVHFVPDEQIDAGPVILSEAVPFHDGDTLEQFTQRMHACEHQLVIKALQKLSEKHNASPPQ